MSATSTTRLDPERFGRAKAAYTTSRLEPERIATLLNGSRTPTAGDIVLARVTEIGFQERVELPDGRRSVLFPGDEIVVCYGHRYAPDQYEAEVPDDLSPCHLVAAGGVAARALSWHVDVEEPTAIEPIGLLGDRNGDVINLKQTALPPVPTPGPRPFTVAVVGTAMNAGKSTAAAHLIRGLTLAGLRVGAAKVTGTGAGKDIFLMVDAGADPVLDFTHAGHPSTFRVPSEEIWETHSLLVGHLCAAGVDAVVIEVADGVYQSETATLLSDRRFAGCVDAVLFAAGDALGAVGGVEWLRGRHLPVAGVAGLVTASPLSTREAADAVDVPVFDLPTLSAPTIATALRVAMVPV
jgi:hypothetical protein